MKRTKRCVGEEIADDQRGFTEGKTSAIAVIKILDYSNWKRDKTS